MTQPEGFDDESGRVWWLKKSLYGLKQAPKVWNGKLSSFMKQLGFKTSEEDECTFIKQNTLTIIAIYVDDGVIFTKEQKTIELILSQLKTQFEVHNMNTGKFLGFKYEIQQDGSIVLHQETWLKQIISRINLDKANSVETPMVAGRVLGGEEISQENHFWEILVSLQYTSTSTRPNIAFEVNRSSRRVCNPKSRDMTAAKRVIRYLEASMNMGIKYSTWHKPELTAYSDADFGGDKSIHSTSGYVMEMAGGPVGWN